MRAIWSGTISFVLVNIPVKLYSAIEREDLELDLIHKKDNSRIRYARFCKKEDREVPNDEIVKGYEYRDGEYVLLTDEDFQQADPKRSKSIEVTTFVDADTIDPIYFEQPYYLEPDKGAAKSFALFIEALTKTNKVAVATFVLRNREHLAILRPYSGILVLQQLRFASELRPPDALKRSEESAGKKELELSISLIEKLSSEFNPAEYKDTYSEILHRVIEDKAKGQMITPVSEPLEPTKVDDLMQKLIESLESSDREPVKGKS